MEIKELDFIPGHLKCIYIVCNLHRLGAMTFLTRLEQEHFPPDTDMNDSFSVFHTFYKEMPYYIIEIPSNAFPLIPPLAMECGLRMMPGKPHAVNKEEFNLKCPDFSCFTLEGLQSDCVGEQDVVAEEHTLALRNEYQAIYTRAVKL